MTETRIYVGLNDSLTLDQKFETEKYANILRNVCISYSIPFSFCIQRGGYFHEDGRFTDENTLVVTLIDVEEETVSEIAKDLCVFFRQESVMITENFIRACFISEKL